MMPPADSFPLGSTCDLQAARDRDVILAGDAFTEDWQAQPVLAKSMVEGRLTTHKQKINTRLAMHVQCDHPDCPMIL